VLKPNYRHIAKPMDFRHLRTPKKSKIHQLFPLFLGEESSITMNFLWLPSSRYIFWFNPCQITIQHFSWFLWSIGLIIDTIYMYVCTIPRKIYSSYPLPWYIHVWF
jgi:hypothetical protein